jgi:hypothetical protein
VIEVRIYRFVTSVAHVGRSNCLHGSLNSGSDAELAGRPQFFGLSLSET